MRLRAFFLSIALSVLISLCGTVYAYDIPAELSRALREAPSLDSLNSGKGFAILRDIQYRLLADGRMERSSLWFIYEGRELPDSWRKWEILVPEGGEASVLEAALYSPSSQKMQYPLLPKEVTRDGVPVIEVRVPNDLEDNILVLSYRQVFQTRMNIEDSVLLELDIPLWEQSITVNVPSGTVPTWQSEGAPDPRLQKGPAIDSYNWSIINTPARKTGLVSPDPGKVLVLSLRKGLRYALTDAGSLAASVGTFVPEQIASMISDPNRTRGGERIINFVNDPSRLLRGFPGGLVRASENIPSEGPWTEWEASFLIYNWLKKAGWDVELFWEPLAPVDDDAPATVSLWKKPVLSVTSPAGKDFIFEVGQRVQTGSMPPRLWGRTVFALEGNSVSRRSIPAGSAADHRLSFRWDLDLSPEGVAKGELLVTVRGAWVDTIAGGGLPDEQEALDILRSFGWVSTPGMPGGDVTLEPLGSGFRIKIPVVTQLGIPGGEGLLVRIPSATMPWQMDIAERGSLQGVRYPFVYEQSFEISFPDGFDVMALPVLRPLDSGSVRIEETLRVRKKHILLGENKLVVASERLDDTLKQVFSNAVRQGLGWSAVTIPMRRR